MYGTAYVPTYYTVLRTVRYCVPTYPYRIMTCNGFVRSLLTFCQYPLYSVCNPIQIALAVLGVHSAGNNKSVADPIVTSCNIIQVAGYPTQTRFFTSIHQWDFVPTQNCTLLWHYVESFINMTLLYTCIYT